ncbi:MAG: hypothetical protein COW74_11160 [Piscirickettsiaceae bacterium CG18_big_fil_WC_8_21_14_2_50_44_103]|nr:MAG: hypothetical protein COW74_11160 [Piscirickettsiaceae bacterium CG18_big_fil_WC_8_21_14_2_50_44_103]
MTDAANIAENIRIIEEANNLGNEILMFKDFFIEQSPELWLPPSWSDCPKNSDDCVIQVAEHCSRYFYKEGQDGRETTTLPGVVLAGKDLGVEVERLNLLKSSFREDLRQLKSDVPISQYRSFISKAFHRKQWNLLQAYRKFHIVDRPVMTVTISWVSSNMATKKISHDEAIESAKVAYENGSKAYQMAIDAINGIEDGGLVQQRPVTPFLSATLKFESGDVKRVNMHSPIFLLNNSRMPSLPFDVPVTPAPKRIRARRSDAKPLDIVDAGLALYAPSKEILLAVTKNGKHIKL